MCERILRCCIPADYVDDTGLYWRSSFFLGKHTLENSNEIKLRQLGNEQYKNAWQDMYDEESKQGKKKINEVWRKTVRPNK